MIILAPTVHHSGSHFLVKHLLRDFQEVPLKNAVTECLPIDSDVVIFDHVWPHKMELWKFLLKRYPAIVPLRQLSNIRASWERRGKKLSEFQKEWNLMFEIIREFNPFILQLDSPCKHDQLDTINERLGLSLDAQGWPVINSKREQPNDKKQALH